MIQGKYFIALLHDLHEYVGLCIDQYHHIFTSSQINTSNISDESNGRAVDNIGTLFPIRNDALVINGVDVQDA